MDPTQCEKPEMEKPTEENNSEPSPSPSTYFESLGLMLNDGKPRFKLDEPVTTALNAVITPDLSTIDEGETLSFVVLGRNSMEAIQASSLASYVDIQQKSMAVDYSSMISSLNADEVQQKLTELLQENMKLKVTLTQNNQAMKEQFNTLAKWQEEVMKVHQNHKQKFSETREFINHLKSENADLKMKLSAQQTENTEHGFQAMPKFDTSDIFIDQTKLLEKISLLTEKLNISELNSTKLEEDVEKYKNMLSTTKRELEDALQEIKKQTLLVKQLAVVSNSNCNETSIKTVENKECSEICSAKDEEIAHLKKSIALLMEKSQCTLTPIQLHDLLDSSSNQNRLKFMQNMKQYNDRLQELIECFSAQTHRYIVIERCLKGITDILEILDDIFDNDKFYLKSQTTENNSLLSKTEFSRYREKLCSYHKELIDEQVKIITERQILVKSQNQFQKMLSDYNSILYELEITIDENMKLNALKNNIVRDNLRKQAEVEKIICDKQLLEEEKKVFNREKDDLEEEKKLLENEKQILDVERGSLRSEKELLQQEKISLSEEKTSLDHQSQLYENQEKALQYEKQSMQIRYEQLLAENKSLQQDIQEKDIKLEELKEQLAQNTEEINLLKTQLTFYEEDFKQEKKVKESLMEEKNKLDVELQKQVDFNKQLQQDIRALQSDKSTTSSRFTEQTEYPNEASTIPPCPKCEKIFINLKDLTEHIERCLDLD